MVLLHSSPLLQKNVSLASDLGGTTGTLTHADEQIGHLWEDTYVMKSGADYSSSTKESNSRDQIQGLLFSSTNCPVTECEVLNLRKWPCKKAREEAPICLVWEMLCVCNHSGNIFYQRPNKKIHNLVSSASMVWTQLCCSTPKQPWATCI